MKSQKADEVVDIANWPVGEFVYPEGAREKSLLYCPTSAPERFLITGHPYLFKYSSHNYPEQFWVEILTYRLGCMIGVPVPPAFVAYDSREERVGALIEWFLKYPSRPTRIGPFGRWLLKNFRGLISRIIVETMYYISSPEDAAERYVPGGDIMQRVIPGFDRKHGTQHNWEDARAWCKALEQHGGLIENWQSYWAKVFTFDALIGNTDRHQDNWGIIFHFNPREKAKVEVRFAPAFDNGTSMGHEIIDRKFSAFNDDNRIATYVQRGTHHMKWHRSNAKRLAHSKFLKRLCEEYPEMRKWMLECLQFDRDSLENMVFELTKYNVPVKLAEERAKFMVKLLLYRQQYLLSEINAAPQ